MADRLTEATHERVLSRWVMPRHPETKGHRRKLHAIYSDDSFGSGADGVMAEIT